MCVTICGRFCPDEGAVAGYGNRIRAKSPAKWGVQIAGMIFQTGSDRGADTGNRKILFPVLTFSKNMLSYQLINASQKTRQFNL